MNPDSVTKRKQPRIIDQPSPARRKGQRMLEVVLIGGYMTSLLIWAVFDFLPSQLSPVLLAMACGYWFSIPVMVAAWSSLTTFSILARFLASLLAIALLIANISVGNGIGAPTLESVQLFACLPLFTLLTGFPFLFMRFVLGATIQLPDFPVKSGQPQLAIDGLMILTATIAFALAPVSAGLITDGKQLRFFSWLSVGLGFFSATSVGLMMTCRFPGVVGTLLVGVAAVLAWAFSFLMSSLQIYGLLFSIGTMSSFATVLCMLLFSLRLIGCKLAFADQVKTPLVKDEDVS